MSSYRKTIMACFLVIALLVSPLSAIAAHSDVEKDNEQISPEAMTVDLLLARPVGLAATVTGAVVFLVSLPFSGLGGNSDEAWNSLVVAPADYTFQRPLGYIPE